MTGKDLRQNRNRLVVIYLIAVFAIVSAGVIIYFALKENLKKVKYNELQSIGQLKESQISDWISERLADARTIQSNPFLISALEKYCNNRDIHLITEISKFFDNIRYSNDYAGVYLLDSTGERRITSASSSLLLPTYNKSIIKLRINQSQIIINDIHVAHNTDRIHLDIFIPISAKNQSCLIVLDVDPFAYLYPLINKAPYETESMEFVIVKRSNNDVIYLNELRHRKESALKLKLPLSLKNLPASQGISGKHGIIDGVDYRNKDVTADFRPIKNTDWFLITKQDNDEIYADLYIRAYLLFAIIAFLITGVALFIFFLFRDNEKKILQEQVKSESEKAELTRNYNKKIVKLNRTLTVLSNINQSIVRVKEKHSLFEEACNIAVADGKYIAAWISEIDYENKKINLIAKSGSEIIPGRSLVAFNDIISLFGIDDNDCIKKDFFVSQNLDGYDPSSEWVKEIMKHDIKSFGIFAISVNGKMDSFISFFSDTDNFFETKEIEILKELAMDLGYALEFMLEEDKRMAAEYQLTENQRILETLFSNLPGMAYRCRYDDDWTMLFMSEGVQQLTGYSREALLYNNLISYTKLILPEFHQMIIEETDKARDSKSQHNFIYKIKRADGEVRWVWEKGKTIFDEFGDVIFIEGFITDINDLKNYEDELLLARELAENADKVKTEFLAQMSHEIRSPINVILSFLGLIKEEVSEKIDKEFLEGFNSISSASKRLIRTIDLILNMSEMQLGSYIPTYRKIDLEYDIINKVVNEYREALRIKGLELFLDIAQDIDFSMYADEYSLGQIAANLIDNAIKYTESGSITVSLKKNLLNKLEMTISDTGIGMSDEYKSRLFTPFSQEEEGYTRKFEGTGLGLALVKNYCNINDAEIRVESEKGKGTSFIITFY
ncbi:MAG: ATP-binding protein [Melioribacteraceae bacterium]|nr:ATP-binding protein [Melioribacteraceae bacterium]